jgi:hypothetical protein
MIVQHVRHFQRLDDHARLLLKPANFLQRVAGEIERNETRTSRFSGMPS